MSFYQPTLSINTQFNILSSFTSPTQNTQSFASIIVSTTTNNTMDMQIIWSEDSLVTTSIDAFTVLAGTPYTYSSIIKGQYFKVKANTADTLTANFTIQTFLVISPVLTADPISYTIYSPAPQDSMIAATDRYISFLNSTPLASYSASNHLVIAQAATLSNLHLDITTTTGTATGSVPIYLQVNNANSTLTVLVDQAGSSTQAYDDDVHLVVVSQNDVISLFSDSIGTTPTAVGSFRIKVTPI